MRAAVYRQISRSTESNRKAGAGMKSDIIRTIATVALGFVFAVTPLAARAQTTPPRPVAQESGLMTIDENGYLQMDMGQAVAYALGQNQTLQSAVEQALAAESGRRSSLGAFGPALSTSYGFQRNRPMTAVNRDDELYTWTVSVEQAVFTGFRLISQYQRAALQRDYYDASRFNTELSLIATVQQNFLSLLKARENVISAQDSLTRLQDQLRVTTAFYEVGLRPRLDVLQAQVDASEAENVLLQAQNTLDTQQARLNTLLNLPVETPITYVGNLEYIPFDATLEQCLSTAYRLRPDITMAGKNTEIAQQEKRMAASNFYPQISALFEYSRVGDTPKVQGSDYYTGDQDYDWKVWVGANWSLFNWGTDYFAVEQARHMVSSMIAQENALNDEVAYEVKSRLLKIGEARKRIRVAQYGLTQAKEAYRVAMARYEAQVGTNTDLLDAQSKLSAAEASLTEAQADYLISLAVLYQSMGVANPALDVALSPQTLGGQ